MKIKQYGPRVEKLKREGETIREIAEEVGLEYPEFKALGAIEARRICIPSLWFFSSMPTKKGLEK